MGTEREYRAPDATQPRVTVRPKPPVLLGATSAMGRWHRAGVVSDNPRPSRPRRLQGSHRDAPRTIFSRILLPTPVTLPLRGSLPFLDPALQRSLGFPPFRLAASLRASLAPTLRCSLEVRRALVSELGTDCATRNTRSMAYSRNPDVLPIFLRVIPKRDRLRPQFFPMVRSTGGQPAWRASGSSPPPFTPVRLDNPAAGTTRPVSVAHLGFGPSGGTTPDLRAGLIRAAELVFGGPYAPSHAAEPGVRPGAGRAGREGPDDAPAVPAHHQRPRRPPATRPRTGNRSSATTRRRC